MLKDLKAQGVVASTHEMVDADVGEFISRMRVVRLAEDRLTSALESMTVESGLLAPGARSRTASAHVATREPKKHRCRSPTGRRPCKAALEAALAARKAKALIREDVAKPKVFVVRYGTPSKSFTWEIRRFGGVVLGRGILGFNSISVALAAGEAMLAATPS
jgi:hypothetical protein